MSAGCRAARAGSARSARRGESRRCIVRYSQEVELARLRPVDVLEHEQRRLLEPEALDEAAGGEEQQGEARATMSSSGAEPEQEREVAGASRRLSGSGISLGHRLRELLARDRERIRLDDPARIPDEERERLVARLLARRAGSGRAGSGRRRARRTRPISRHSVDFPMPGGPTTVTRCGRRSVDRPRPDRSQEHDLSRSRPTSVALRERPHRRLGHGLDDQPRLDRLGLSLRVDRRCRLVADRVPRGAMRLGADDQPSGRGRRL